MGHGFGDSSQPLRIFGFGTRCYRDRKMSRRQANDVPRMLEPEACPLEPVRR